MELYRELLRRPRLAVLSGEPDGDLDRMATTIAPCVRVAGQADLAAVFERLLLASDEVSTIAPKTLDLLGHSTPGASQLRLGDWVIDAGDRAVTSWFCELAGRRVLPRLGVHAVRLLACGTAATPAGQSTICALARILGIEVYGTKHLLYDLHYDEHGFRDTWQFLLVCARDLRPAPDQDDAMTTTSFRPHVLDLDALPALPLGPRVTTWPRRIATPMAARQIVELIRRDAGAEISALRAAPVCELAMPAPAPRMYHFADVLLDGAFLRFYPAGPAARGIAYPVDDPNALRRIVDQLASSESVVVERTAHP